MNRVVIFTENNARIVTNPEDLDYFKRLPNALINPDFSKVKGIPPHFWKCVDGKLEAMSADERSNASIDEHRIDNRVDYTKNVYKEELVKLRSLVKFKYIAIAEFILLAALIGLYVFSK